MLSPLFRRLVERNLSLGKTIKVAVVGGSLEEHEIQILQELELHIEVDIFGIDQDSILLDLNIDYLDAAWKDAYDLVICAQVLEHVWNTNIAIKNIHSLARVGGLIWINCPASNHVHGSPEFFSAGFQSQYLLNHLHPMGFEPISFGEIGSERLYKMTHSQFFWPSELEHKFPLLRGIASRSYLFPLKFASFFLRNIQALLWSGKTLEGSKFSTETYCAGRKLATALK